MFNVVLILLGQHCTSKSFKRCCPRGSRHHCTRKKILFSVVLILLGQHCTDKNAVQCSPRSLRQHCTGKNPVRCCLNSGDKIAELKTLCIAQDTPGKIAQEKSQFIVVWTTSLFGNFYFELVNFLIITGCCKCRTSIALISPTLLKKNPELTFNKKTRLYRTKAI